MEKCLIFIHKPTILIYLDDIVQVECNRLSESSQRFFEMSIKTRKGEDYEFNNIERKEYEPLNKYFQDKNVKFSSDEDVEGVDNNYTTRKVRKAPEQHMDIDLPSEEESVDEDFSADGEDFSGSSEGESRESQSNKKDKKNKKR